jgi:putative membrane protein
MKTMILTVVLAGGAALALAQPGTRGDATGGREMSDMSGAQDMGAGSDASLAATIKAINDGEIKQSKMADKRARSKEVKSFAKMMVRDHTQNNTEIAQVSKRIGLQPTEDSGVLAMKQQAQQSAQALESESGGDFDRAYIDQMVKDHEDALKKLDEANKANGGERDPQFENLLRKTRLAVNGHLEEAKRIQSQLGSSGRSTEGSRE